MAERVAIALIREGRVRRAYLGIGGQRQALSRRVVRHFDLPQDSGVRIDSVAPESPAARAGFLRGDIVLSLEGTPVTDVDDLQRLLGAPAIDRQIVVVALRGTQLVTRDVIPIEATRIPR